jgi:hypothetical protein
MTSFPVGSSRAIAADGTVYIGPNDSCLYAVVGDSPLADSPGPSFTTTTRTPAASAADDDGKSIECRHRRE